MASRSQTIARLACFLLVGVLPLRASAGPPAKEVAEVATGVVQGFLDKTDLNDCIQGNVKSVKDVQEAIEDFENKTASSMLQGLKSLGAALNELPDALRLCNATVDEVKSMEQALQQFSNPANFTYNVGKNLLINGKDIYSEITTAVNDYKTKNYRDLGVQVGSVLRNLVVGAAQHVMSIAHPPASAFGKMAEGLVQGFLGKTDLNNCMQESTQSVKDVHEAIDDFENKTATSVLNGLKVLGAAISEMPDALKLCNATKEEVESMEKALQQFKSPTKFAYHAGKNLLINGKDIYTEITTAVSDYKAKNYKDFGVQVGSVLRNLIVGIELIV